VTAQAPKTHRSPYANGDSPDDCQAADRGGADEDAPGNADYEATGDAEADAEGDADGAADSEGDEAAAEDVGTAPDEEGETARIAATAAVARLWSAVSMTYTASPRVRT
jgi:hypothetical protein